MSNCKYYGRIQYTANIYFLNFDIFSFYTCVLLTFIRYSFVLPLIFSFIILVDRKKIFAARRGAEITRKAYLQSFERLFYPIVDIDKHIVQWMPPDQRKSYIIQRIQEKLNDLE